MCAVGNGGTGGLQGSHMIHPKHGELFAAQNMSYNRRDGQDMGDGDLTTCGGFS